MKSAMQELKDWANQYKGQMISADQVVLQAHNLLKKEKEQIIKAHIDGFDYIVAEFKKQEYAEEYFNKTYKNQTP
jgi:short-subunit dehydrogenase